jgi:LysM domain
MTLRRGERLRPKPFFLRCAGVKSSLRGFTRAGRTVTVPRMCARILCPLAAAVAMLGGPAAATAAFPHVVVRGESLSSVAAADGLTVRQLAAANGLSPSAPLIAGSTLLIPPRCRNVLPHTVTCALAPPSSASTTTAASVSQGGAHDSALRHWGHHRHVLVAAAHGPAGGKLGPAGLAAEGSASNPCTPHPSR